MTFQLKVQYNMKNNAVLFKKQTRCNFSIFLKYFFFSPPMRMCAFKCLNELNKKFQAQTVSSSLQFLVPGNNLDMMWDLLFTYMMP